jgi:hypothetical protein
MYLLVLILIAIVLVTVFISSMELQTSHLHASNTVAGLVTTSDDSNCPPHDGIPRNPPFVKDLVPPRLLDNCTLPCWMTNSPLPADDSVSASHLRATLATIAIAANLGFNFVYTPPAPYELRSLSSLDAGMINGIQRLFRSISDLPSYVPICNVLAPSFSPRYFCNDWYM